MLQSPADLDAPTPGAESAKDPGVDGILVLLKNSNLQAVLVGTFDCRTGSESCSVGRLVLGAHLAGSMRHEPQLDVSSLRAHCAGAHAR